MSKIKFTSQFDFSKCFIMECLRDFDVGNQYAYQKDGSLFVRLSNKTWVEYINYLQKNNKKDEKFKNNFEDYIFFDGAKQNIFDKNDPFLLFLLSRYKYKNNSLFKLKISSEKFSYDKGEYVFWGHQNLEQKKMDLGGLYLNDENKNVNWKEFYEVVCVDGLYDNDCSWAKLEINDIHRKSIEKEISNFLQNQENNGIDFLMYVKVF